MAVQIVPTTNQQEQIQQQNITNQLRNTLSGTPVFLQQSRLQQLIDWVISNPSIPLSLRKQFIFMWEIVPLGNYTDLDILFLMSKFREWCITVIWCIPENVQGNVQHFPGDNDSEQARDVDITVLFNELQQIYFINLTRGRGGFTTKELNTMRSLSSQEITAPGMSGGNKGIRLF